MVKRSMAIGMSAVCGVLSGFSLGQGEGSWGGTTLIPRAVLFGNPDRANVQVSPDGKHLSWLADVGGVMNVFVSPTEDLSKARAITKDTKRNIRQYQWAYDNEHVLYLQDVGGDENWKVYSANVATGAVRDLTPFEEIKGPDGKAIMLPSGTPMRPTARLQGVSERFPGELLVGLNVRNPQLHDVYRVNIATGAMELVFQNDGWVGVITDDDFVPRFAQRMTPDGGSEIAKLTKQEGGWSSEPFETIGMEDMLTTGFGGFGKTGQTYYMVDSRGRDTGALFTVDLKDGSRRLLAASDKADIGGTLMHPTEKTVQAAAFNHTRTEWQVLDPSIEGDLSYLKGVERGELSVVDRSLDDRRWVVAFAKDDGPAKFYLYERRPGGGGEAKYLFSNRSKIEGLALSPMHPVVIKSRDGLDLVSFLTLPAWSDKDRDGKPEGGALPMVLLVHGGPWARDAWGYNGYHQWLANRGYAVLSVNFRGSTGFGKSFINAGNREWAGKMHDDLLDAVEWAVSRGVARKDRVGIMGGSYGGYATLVGLTFTPDVFACGVDIVGPSSIATLLSTIPPYWAPMIDMFVTRVGDHRTEEGRRFLDSRSPLTFVDRIEKPLLIGQGANDPRVKQSESDQIVKAMQSKGIPVTYVLFPDEGHGFARPENNTAFNAIVEAFLSKHLGGRFEAVGDDVVRSSAQVLTGLEGVPGLSAGVVPGK
ncbi:MAG: S9 family peptidase [Phycisphaeraceae bacterium]|nr:MAG: S9 family peptidase [Phycisphaeraceae bacterium]